MPNVPKWVADQMENLLASRYIDVLVASTIQYSPGLKKIVFKGALSHIGCYPGSSMVFRASDRELRHYTPSAFDSEAGTFEVIFHVHGKGPGSDLADRLVASDRLKVSAPGGKKLYDKDQKAHFFFGDETSLSFYDTALREIRRHNQSARGIFEMDESNSKVPGELGFDITTVRKTPEQPASHAMLLLEDSLASDPALREQSAFYLTGNVASVQQLRKVLKKHGVSSGNIKLQGYWAEGSVGL